MIPVYNEAHVLEGSVARLAEAMADYGGFEWRIVVVDNGSKDGTGEIAKRLSLNHDYVASICIEEMGRGRALRRTWTESSADYSIYMDVDLSTELSAIPRAVGLLEAGADVVSGSRLDKASEIQRCLKREVLSRGYNFLIRSLLWTRSFDDAQCGFKGVRLKTVRSILPLIKNQNWFFDTELLVLSEFAGLTIRTFPIEWIEDPDTRVHIPSTVWEDLKGLARLRWTARTLTQQVRTDGD